MERSTPAQQQAEAPAVVLNQLGIRLTAPHIDTAHINPDFLRYNEIVDPDWPIDPPVIIESGFSLIEYDNGLSITATNDDLVISHRSAPLATDEIVSPSVAIRYLVMAPWPVEYSAVHIGLVGSMDTASLGIAWSLSPLNHLSSRMFFHDNAPNVQARAFYEFDDKSITMYISETGDDNIVTGVHFSAHIHRGIDSGLSLVERIEFVDSVIDNWKDDISSFEQFASQFYRNYSI